MTSAHSIAEGRQGSGPAILAALLLLYVLITLNPFPDISGYASAVTMDTASNTLNQVVALLLLGSAVMLALRRDLRGLVMQPRLLVFSIFAWLFVTTMLGDAGIFGVRKLVLAGLLVAGASAFLLLPRDERQFAAILMTCAAIVIALCYAGVMLLPGRSIHQSGDYLEPMLAGAWRGLFDHKNNAAPAMAMLIFMALYAVHVRWRALALLVIGLATFFLYQAGGRTALALLPLTLVLTWLLERGNLFTRLLVLFGAVGGYSLLTLGAAISPPVRQLVAALGVDETFSGRADIWQIALDGIAARPWLGYGYQGFWGTETVVYGLHEESSWAGLASSAHNGYLETLLAGGIVALALGMLWLFVAPLLNLSAAIARHGRSHLTRLYTRMWLFCLIMGCMESLFLSPNGAIWFCMLVGMAGLGMQARATQRLPEPQATQRHGAAPQPA